MVGMRLGQNAVFSHQLKKSRLIQEETLSSAGPMLKWPGGKRWLVSEFPELFPHKFNVYREPFLGSGAVFFFLRPEQAVLSDINKELIEFYKSVKNRPTHILNLMGVHKRKHSHNYYQKIRSSSLPTSAERGARFLYLNQTCWNGLYRVNKNGVFNVDLLPKN